MANSEETQATDKLGVIAAAAGLILLLVLLITGTEVVAAFVMAILLAVAVYLILQYGFGGSLPKLPKTMGPLPGGMAARAAAAPTLPPKPAEAPAAEAPVVKPSAPLAGEAELAERKGTWSYAPEADDTEEEPADIPDVAPSPGTKPELMSAAREGGPDNLKEIKGVGPKLEELLHEMGVFHFDQIAVWGPDEVAWMDDNLKGFKGRVSRDDWVAQAKILADGGETEFSKKVDKGGVY